MSCTPVFLTILAAGSTRRLTRTGEQLLAKLRVEEDRPHPTRGSHNTAPFENICWSLALMGLIVLADIPAFAAMHQDLQKQMGNAAAEEAEEVAVAAGTNGMLKQFEPFLRRIAHH